MDSNSPDMELEQSVSLALRGRTYEGVKIQYFAILGLNATAGSFFFISGPLQLLLPALLMISAQAKSIKALQNTDQQPIPERKDCSTKDLVISRNMK